MQDNMIDQIGYEGTDEYTPVGADPSASDKDAGKVEVEGSAHAALHVYKWNAESKYFTAEMSAPGQLALRLFRYPAWRVKVNGRPVPTGKRESTGQILVPVGAGMNQVQITFIRTMDRKLGGLISLLTAFALLLGVPETRRRIQGWRGAPRR
jgi:hypothetical protein